MFNHLFRDPLDAVLGLFLGLFVVKVVKQVEILVLVLVDRVLDPAVDVALGIEEIALGEPSERVLEQRLQAIRLTGEAFEAGDILLGRRLDQGCSGRRRVNDVGEMRGHQAVVHSAAVAHRPLKESVGQE